ncbi:MAG: hypothetical protein ACFE96_01675, partial [Candidatus Hermodarchaeota archaeon]
NFYYEVLRFIVWNITGYDNSPQGRPPISFSDWLVEKIVDIAQFVVGIFIAIGEFFVNLWNAVMDTVGDVLMAAIDFLAQMLWLLIRAIVFILAWVLLAVFLFSNLLFFGVLALMALVIGLISNKTPEITFMSVKFDFFDDEFYYHSWISMRYIEFFDLEIPIVITEISISNITLVKFCSDFIFGSDEEESYRSSNLKSPSNPKAISEKSNPRSPILNAIISLINSKSEEIGKNSLSSNPNSFDFNFTLFSFGFTSVSALACITIAILSGIKGATHKTIPMFISLLSALFLGLLLTYVCEREYPKTDDTISLQLGIGFAFLMAFFEMWAAKKLRLLKVKTAEKWDQFIPSGIDLLAYIINIFSTFFLEDEEFDLLKNIMGGIAIVVGIIAMFVTSMITVGLLWGKRRTAEPEAECGYFGLEVIFLLLGIVNFVPAIIEMICRL